MHDTRPMHDTQTPKCGAQTRDGDPCKNPPVSGGKRCRMHGGQGQRGLANPAYKHGRYTDAVPRSLGADYDRAVSDPDTLNLTHEINIIDARLRNLLDKSDTGEATRIWTEVKRAWREYKRANSRRDGPAMQAALDQVDELIGASGNTAAWQEIGSLIEQRRKLVESEGKRRVTMQTMVTVERLDLILGHIATEINETVPDPEVRRRLGHKIALLVEGEVERMEGMG